MALTDVLPSTNSNGSNGSVETWGGRAALFEASSGRRRVEVMVTKGGAQTALDHVLGPEIDRPILKDGEPTGETRFARELPTTLVAELAVVGDFALSVDNESAEAAEAMRRLRESDVTWVSPGEFVPLDPGVEPPSVSSLQTPVNQQLRFF